MNFSRSKSEFDLAARRAIRDIEGKEDIDVTPYLDEDSAAYEQMVDKIRKNIHLKLTSLRYQRLEDMAHAIGLPQENLCTYCWRR